MSNVWTVLPSAPWTTIAILMVHMGLTLCYYTKIWINANLSSVRSRSIKKHFWKEKHHYCIWLFFSVFIEVDSDVFFLNPGFCLGFIYVLWKIFLNLLYDNESQLSHSILIVRHIYYSQNWAYFLHIQNFDSITWF